MIFVTLFNYKQVKNELICIKQVSQNIREKHSHKKYCPVVIKIKGTLKGKWEMQLIPPNGSQGIDCRELDC